MVAEGTLLWTPSPERCRRAQVTRFAEAVGLPGADPQQLWRWSVEHLEEFWDAVWRFCGVVGERGDGPVLASDTMPGAVWYPSARLNYAENALTRWQDRDGPALLAHREDGRAVALSGRELADAVARAAAGLRRLGVRRGDRVAAVLPNAEYALIGLLATACLGAIWSSCSPDFGPTAILDRFRQIEPTVLLGADGYRYNGRGFSILDRLTALRDELPTLDATVLVPYLDEQATLPGALAWADLLAEPAELRFERVGFDHPLWILYSSGTTGLPKAIVQGHGGIIVEHLKQLVLHFDLGPDDRFFWFTTTGWMMWNLLVSGLLCGSAIVAYDGSPGWPDLGTLWRLAEQAGITCFGVSAPYLDSCRAAGLVPREVADLSRVQTVGSTGAPLSPEGFGWVYDAVAGPGADLLLASVSGGTDVCTAFAAGLPVAPVHAGELQTRTFGCAAAAFDEAGREVLDQVGELVVTKPLPSMPIGFWGDADGSRYRDAYFADYPGVWRHGDWCKVVSDRGSMVIYGRSDSTLNRGGVRIGTAEFYRVVEQVPEVADSLVVDVGHRLLLFVVPTDGVAWSGDVAQRIRLALRSELSPRHVPDDIQPVAAVPRTLNGKKLEVPVKRILTGTPLERAVSTGAVANPDALAPFVELSVGGDPTG